mmetsp:Transcript_51115/g.119710  ORF Transcript_51115/g.119710 Transcript_51115/m.119710 type:complete len:86 (-) Transcript_51115:397-654(-)
MVQSTAKDSAADGASGPPHCQAHQAANSWVGARERERAISELVVEVAPLICQGEKLCDEDYSVVTGRPAQATHIERTEEISSVTF